MCGGAGEGGSRRSCGIIASWGGVDFVRFNQVSMRRRCARMCVRACVRACVRVL